MIWSVQFEILFYYYMKGTFHFSSMVRWFLFLLSMTEKISVQLLIVERKIISSICHAHEVDERSVHITVCKFLNNLWRGAAASSFSSLSLLNLEVEVLGLIGKIRGANVSSFNKTMMFKRALVLKGFLKSFRYTRKKEEISLKAIKVRIY